MDEAPQTGLVSIVTPAYNAAEHIAETIASVKAQTYADWEMLVVDDASTDQTAALVEGEAESEPRIRLIRLEGENRLPARARNAGMAQARGEFIALLDADDLWVPEKLDRQVEYLREHPEADGVCCWYSTFGDPERVRIEQHRMKTGCVCQRSEVVDGMPFFTLTILFRRSCYETLGGMDEDPRLYSTEDMEFFARLVIRCEIHRQRMVLAKYRLAALDAPSLSLGIIQQGNERSWKVAEVLREKGLLTPSEVRRQQSYLHYEQARMNLHLFHRPFRRHLVKAVLAGSPSWQTLVTLSLCFLPGPVLSRVLMGMQARLNGVKKAWFRGKA